jgi:PDZ domain-containing protein
MRRRGVTVLLGALVTALLSIGVLAAPVPYVLLGPGPTVDTLGERDGTEVVQISGIDIAPTQGQLRLTTVGVQPEIKLLTALRGWFSEEQAVVPYEMIYPPGQSREQVDERNAEDFAASQSSAETAALRELGYPVQVIVKSVVADGPAAGLLREGDQLTSVDGGQVATATELTRMIRAKPAGTALNIGYVRDGTAGTVTVVSRAQDSGPPRIGVEIEQQQPHPFELKIDLENIGGPSAGLMFALGIIDKVKPEDLTGGRIIAGTGSIDELGNVGAIGGIPQKLVGARKAGATAFLVPAENCAEAVRNAQPGLALIRVATLDDALSALETLREGGEPARC